MGAALIAGRLLPGHYHQGGRVGIVDNVDNQFLSAGLIAGGRGAM